MTSSIYPIAVSPVSGTIAVDTDILQNDILITKEMVSPGGGGILRLYFSFNVTADAEIDVLNDGSTKGILNADNNKKIVSDGYYRFDVDVEAGDKINLQSDVAIDTVNFIRAHLVQFGA
jgi:hypothetical protein